MLKGNNRFDWTHTYYKGEKFEELGEKIFKYSLVELVDCPYEPDAETKCTKAVIDYFLYRYDESDDVFKYNQSLLKDYIDKVLPLKFGFEGNRLRLPSIDNKEIWYSSIDGGDFTNYHNLKDEFAYNTFTNYVNMIADNISIRKTDKLIANCRYLVDNGKEVIATSTNIDNTIFSQGIIGVVGIVENGTVFHFGLSGPHYCYLGILPFRLVII